jgi:hypothetical protein
MHWLRSFQRIAPTAANGRSTFTAVHPRASAAWIMGSTSIAEQVPQPRSKLDRPLALQGHVATCPYVCCSRPQSALSLSGLVLRVSPRPPQVLASGSGSAGIARPFSAPRPSVSHLSSLPISKRPPPPHPLTSKARPRGYGHDPVAALPGGPRLPYIQGSATRIWARWNVPLWVSPHSSRALGPAGL